MTTLEQKVRQFGLDNISRLLEITPGALIHKISVLDLTISEFYVIKKALKLENTAVEELLNI